MDNRGPLYYAMTQTNTHSDIICLFMRDLMDILDLESPGWKEDTILLLDGARYHTSTDTKAFLRESQVQYAFTAPYSFTSSPIEKVFAALKYGNLNPANI